MSFEVRNLATEIIDELLLFLDLVLQQFVLALQFLQLLLRDWSVGASHRLGGGAKEGGSPTTLGKALPAVAHAAVEASKVPQGRDRCFDCDVSRFAATLWDAQAVETHCRGHAVCHGSHATVTGNGGQGLPCGVRKGSGELDRVVPA